MLVLTKTYCQNFSELYTHNPWFVEEVVDNIEWVDAWHSSVLKSDDYVPPVFVGILDVLPNENKVRLKGPTHQRTRTHTHTLIDTRATHYVFSCCALRISLSSSALVVSVSL